MDIDALTAARRPRWERLHELATRPRLRGRDVDDLHLLYRSVSADLAAVRAASPDPDVIRALSADLARARGRLTVRPRTRLVAVSRFILEDLPAALWHLRWWTLAVTLACLVVAGVEAWWLLDDPSRMASLGSRSSLEQYAREEFVAYYSQDTSQEFAASVWANNALIALECIGAGFTGFFPVQVLLQNSVNVGAAGAIVTEYAGVWQFFRFILPHGLLELTAVFIAGAAGLRVFAAILLPGDRTRVDAVAHAGRSMLVVALGLVGVLFVSGILEGFLTPSALPGWVKVGVGAAATLLLWVYTLVLGRAAAHRGVTGDLTRSEVGAQALRIG